MKYLKQFSIILAISFAGEALARLVPLPIPGSIYGLIILFVLLQTKLLKLSDVHETSKFLIEIMPILFIPAAVGMMTSWRVLKPVLLPYGVITVVSTFLVMIITGHMTQLIIKHQN